MDENKSNETTGNYSLVKPTGQKKYWGRVGDWFKALWKGFVYGMTDLFLASWTNIILLIMLLVIPLIYGVVCAVGYWNPMENLGKVELPIFDQDKTFIKVQEKILDKNTKKYVYHIGAIDEVLDANNEPVTIPDLGTSQDLTLAQNEAAKLQKGNYTFVLNNGFIVKSGQGVTLSPINSWDSIKNGLLVKKQGNKSDTDSKFALGDGLAPNKEMNFRNIRYVNDHNKIGKYWKTSKYQVQIKIADGYGKALVGMQGMAYTPSQDFQTMVKKYEGDLKDYFNPDGTLDIGKIKDPELLLEAKELGNIKFLTGNKLPNIDIFQTFEKNFISGFIMGDLSQFATQIISQVAPFTDGFQDSRMANETFGTRGSIIKQWLSDDNLNKKGRNDSALIRDRANLVDNDYYLVLSKADFMNSYKDDFIDGNKIDDSQTLLGTNGKFVSWLDDINNFANNTGYAAIKPDSSFDMKLIADLEKNYKKIANDDFTSGVKSLLTQNVSGNNDGTKLIQSLITTFGPVYGTATTKLIGLVPQIFKATPVFLNSDGSLKAFTSGDSGNLYKIFTTMMNDNEKPFFPFFASVRQIYENQGTQKLVPEEMPLTLLGSVYAQMQKAELTNGADTSKLLEVEDPRGNQIAIYGIGLGQMFVFLGIYIGFTMLRASLRRNKQYAKLTPVNWYVSKIFQYIVIGLAQTTLTTWILYGAGWHNYISASAMCDLWAWFLMSTFVLMSVICGLQYALNPAIGGALAVIYLAINVTCSGSSYPGWMEFGFYRAITYVTPFKYLIQGSDQIIYGVNLINSHWSDLQNQGVDPSHLLHMANNTLLELWGYASCFFVFFIGIGFLGCDRAYKVSCYGSARGKQISETLEYLKKDDLLEKFRTTYIKKDGRTGIKYNWRKLDGPFDPEFFQTTRHLKFEKNHFEWYKSLRKKRQIEEQNEYDR